MPARGGAAQPMHFESAEIAALAGLLAELTGDQPEGLFANDGTDSLADPRTRGLCRLFDAAGWRHVLPVDLKDRR